jgi:hypothetical protein
MRPVPIPDSMVPTDEPAKKIVVGPPPSYSILDDNAPLPVETVVLEDGFHIRIVLEDDDIEDLKENPHFWLIFQSSQIPVFAILTEKKAIK